MTETFGNLSRNINGRLQNVVFENIQKQEVLFMEADVCPTMMNNANVSRHKPFSRLCRFL